MNGVVPIHNRFTVKLLVRRTDRRNRQTEERTNPMQNSHLVNPEFDIYWHHRLSRRWFAAHLWESQQWIMFKLLMFILPRDIQRIVGAFLKPGKPPIIKTYSHEMCNMEDESCTFDVAMMRRLVADELLVSERLHSHARISFYSWYPQSRRELSRHRKNELRSLKSRKHKLRSHRNVNSHASSGRERFRHRH